MYHSYKASVGSGDHVNHFVWLGQLFLPTQSWKMRKCLLIHSRVRCLTALVATMPVPASPSGGQTGIPAFKWPDTSSLLAPSGVRNPAFSPAGKTLGRISVSFPGVSFRSYQLVELGYHSGRIFLVAGSMGSIPDASPMPRTFLTCNLPMNETCKSGQIVNVTYVLFIV